MIMAYHVSCHKMGLLFLSKKSGCCRLVCREAAQRRPHLVEVFKTEEIRVEVGKLATSEECHAYKASPSKIGQLAQFLAGTVSKTCQEDMVSQSPKGGSPKNLIHVSKRCEQNGRFTALIKRKKTDGSKRKLAVAMKAMQTFLHHQRATFGLGWAVG